MEPRVYQFWRRLRQDRRGNVLVLAAASMPLLLGAAGLAVDTANWTYWKRQLQRSADSAAIAGAYARMQGQNATTAASADLGRTNTITLYGAASIQNAPTSGAYAGNNSAVRVSISTQKRLPFSGSFMDSIPIITATATATVIQTGDFCALALGSGSVTGITMQGNASLTFGCDLATNSNNSTKAVVAGGSSSITAGSVTSVGGLPSDTSHYVGGTKLLPYSPQQSDPYATLPNPTVPSPCQNNVTIKPSDTVTLATTDNGGKGACYKNGLDIKGTVTFKPGVYYIDGGTLNFESGAIVNVDATGVAAGGETGVTFVLTSSNAASSPSSIATLQMNGNATVQLTASTTGTYKGILFYQDRRALDSGTDQINGSASTKFQGAFYFPSQELSFTGTAGMTTDCIQLVGLRLTFTGNTNISNNCPAGSGSSSFKGQQVRLVE